jgi:hypothetical protein
MDLGTARALIAANLEGVVVLDRAQLPDVLVAGDEVQAGRPGKGPTPVTGLGSDLLGSNM